MRCAKCGAELDPGERFCGECGQPVQESSPSPAGQVPVGTCPKCGAKQDPGTRFCSSCGYDLMAASPKPQPAVTDQDVAPAHPVIARTSSSSSRTAFIVVALVAIVLLGSVGAGLWIWFGARGTEEANHNTTPRATPTVSIPSATPTVSTPSATPTVSTPRATPTVSIAESMRSSGPGTVATASRPKIDAQDAQPTPSPTRPKKSISGGVLNGRAISLPKPPYPPIAKQVQASGTVVVQVVIDESGSVISAHAFSGHPLLQAVSVVAARQARFSPTKLAGQPVKVSGVITYNFVAP